MGKLKLIINIPFVWPYLLLYRLSKQKLIINEDMNSWYRVVAGNSTCISNYLVEFYKLFIGYPEFRSLFYYRLGRWSKLIKWLYSGQDHLGFDCKEIGGGMYIQHGYCTDISARHIGKNCWINQKVTIGYKGNNCPWIGDDVRIGVGAIVLGNITIGDRAKIGAGAIVIHDVPADALVVCEPAKIK